VYVSTTSELKASLIQMAFAREGIGNVVVKVLPNAGFDIGPFLFGFQEEIRRHDICLRLHSKKSTHGDATFGIAWRRHIMRELLDDPNRVRIAVEGFLRHTELGMIVPAHWRGVGQHIGIGDNWVWFKWLLDRLGIAVDPEQPIDYPSGSMFWFRSAALEPLLALKLTSEDFAESNEENRDSTLAHGVERVFLFAAAKAGMTWARLPERTKIAEPSIEECAELIRESGLFDPEFYRSHNEDVATSNHDPLDHFMRYGYREGRDPSATFNTRYYARVALRDYGWDGNPLVHYILEGRAKGLRTMPAQKERPVPALFIVEDLYAPYKRVERGADYLGETFPLLRPTTVKVLAFYFPQYHPFPENDRFWGRGFTEWTNTTKAQPMFPGHYQPRLPGELGFYDTRIKDVLARQIELAKQYGVHGFCFHHYFFNGKPVMRAPFNQMIANRDLDIPFCLHWANEPWTVRWDGLATESGTLLDQRHSPEDDLSFFDDIAPALSDPRYITVDGRPLLVIYRPGLFPDMAATIERWRRCCARLGLKDLYLAVVHTSFEGPVDPRKYGFDAAIEYPPHNLPPLVDASKRVNLYDPEFDGSIFDYRQALERSLERPKPDYTWFRGLIPAWDCTPRRANPSLFINASPELYRKWLEGLCTYTERELGEREQFIFVNSWNEWAEGAYLEPDRKYGYAYLDATARALSTYERPYEVRTTLSVLAAAHVYYTDLLDEFLGHFARIPGRFDVLLTVSDPDTGGIESRVRSKLGPRVGRITVMHVENVGRDGAPFLLHALPESQRYDVCCWTHSKKSPYDAEYASWRTYLLDNLLGSEENVGAILDSFIQHPDIGVIFPKPFPPVAGKVEWGSNFARTSELLGRLGIRVQENEDPVFPPGMMFWFRPAALQPLLDLGLTKQDFVAQADGPRDPATGFVVDGTISHALERMVLYVARSAGYSWKEFLDKPFVPG
jgi:lipopolysaccharide biosynthesis protein